jgi:hypothetical protein
MYDLGLDIEELIDSEPDAGLGFAFFKSVSWHSFDKIKIKVKN